MKTNFDKFLRTLPEKTRKEIESDLYVFGTAYLELRVKRINPKDVIINSEVD